MIAAALITAVVVALVGWRLRRRLVAARPAADRVHATGKVRFRRRQLRDADDAQVAGWCEQVASALRGGDSLTRAVLATEAGWSGPPIMPSVAHAVRRGRGLAEALHEVPADPSTATGLVAGVLRSCAELGGPAASAIERAATTLHGRSTERAERRAASAQARLSARVLTFVPFAVLAVLAGTDPAIRSALASAPGLACLALGAVLNLLGWWWMRRLIGGAS
jgi:tight adherence protein B